MGECIYHLPQSSWTVLVLLSSGSWLSQPAHPSSPLAAGPPAVFRLVLLPVREGRARAMPPLLPDRAIPLPARPILGVGEVVRAGGSSHLGLSHPVVPAIKHIKTSDFAWMRASGLTRLELSHPAVPAPSMQTPLLPDRSLHSVAEAQLRQVPISKVGLSQHNGAYNRPLGIICCSVHNCLPTATAILQRPEKQSCRL